MLYIIQNSKHHETILQEFKLHSRSLEAAKMFYGLNLTYFMIQASCDISFYRYLMMMNTMKSSIMTFHLIGGRRSSKKAGTRM